MSYGQFTDAPPGNTTKGAKIFKTKCGQCHTIDAGVHKQGPSLNSLLGRTSGTMPGYNYSSANQNSGIKWDEQSLYQYLWNPKKMIPGTKMVFPGLKKEQDRADLISFLKKGSA